MMRNPKFCRLIALTLAVFSLISLAACKGRDSGPEKVKLTSVFGYESIPVPKEIQNIDRAAISGEKIFFCGSGYDEATQVYSNALYVMNFDGSELTKLFDMEEARNDEEQIYRSRYIQTMAVDSLGNLWVNEQEYYDDFSDPDNPIWEQNSYIRKFSPTGDKVFEIDCKELMPGVEYIYINSMVFDAAGNLYMGMDMSLYILSGETGTLAGKLEQTDYINGVISSANGEIYVSGWGNEGGMQLRKVDTATKAWGETIELPNSNMYNLMPGSGEYDFYYQDSSAIHGYKLATSESQEVLNWINSDINSERMSTVVPLADGRMVAMQWPEQESDPKLLMMTPRDPDSIPETIVLTYAAMWLNSDVRSAIIKFNRSQEEFRIQVKDYNQYSTSDNWMAGYEKLNMDIVQGNVPDIINLEGLNIENYINKGLLADVYKFIDEDPELSRDMFLQNVLDAASRDGKLYQVIPTFSIFTVIGKSKIVGNQPGWTMEDLNALMASLPEGTIAFSEMTRGNIISYSTMMAMDQFINHETGKVSFDGDGFISLLEFANQFAAEIDWNAIYGDNYDWEAQQSVYKDDKVILMPTSIYNVRDIRDYREQFNDDITFIGFPTANKNGTCIMPNTQMAISAKSKNQDAAWQFLRTFLTEEYFSGNEGRYYYGLPINKVVLQKQLEMEKTPLADRPESEQGNIIGRSYSYSTMTGGGAVAVSDMTIGMDPQQDEYEKNYHLTDAEAEQIWSLITSVNTLSYSDQEINTILTEEVEYFFQGNKTAREVASVIQSKVQTYINESR